MYMFVCMLLMQAFMFLFHISILTYYITKQCFMDIESVLVKNKSSCMCMAQNKYICGLKRMIGCQNCVNRRVAQ